MTPENLGEKFIDWAKKKAHIRVLLLIGSRARGAEDYGGADRGSDWDFQVATSEGCVFLGSTWMVDAGLGKPLAYVVRRGRLWGGIKVSIVTHGGELDIVVISALDFVMLSMLYRTGLVKCSARASQGVRNLSLVWKGGVVVLKGSKGVKRFVSKIRRRIGDGRLDDDAIVQIAEGFVCDYVSTRRKLDRGEIVAAQRWLHLHLGEANLALFHELRQRERGVSFPDARRVESFLSVDELRLISVDAALDKRSIAKAAYRSASTCEFLVHQLLQGRWHWPELPSSLRIEELRDDVL